MAAIIPRAPVTTLKLHIPSGLVLVKCSACNVDFWDDGKVLCPGCNPSLNFERLMNGGKQPVITATPPQAPARPCQYCDCGTTGYGGEDLGGCRTPECPGNPKTQITEDPALLKAIHDAVVAEACRWRGIPKPTGCGEFVRITDIWRYARVALVEVRKFDSK